MAVITINEISKNYNFAVGTNTFATVALPITASWGPGYFDPDTIVTACQALDTERDWDAENHSDMLGITAWRRFPATQAGLESFISTYRGPVANYRLANDYSYQMALTLMGAGYDVLVCRISPGAKSSAKFVIKGDSNQSSNFVTVTAKYPGAFGNNLRVEFRNIGYMYNTSAGSQWSYYWNMIVSIVDSSGVKSAVENKMFVFDIDDSNEQVPHYLEIESEFVDISVSGTIPDYAVVTDPDTDEEKTERVLLIDANSVSLGDNVDHTWAVLAGGTDKGSIPVGSYFDAATGKYDGVSTYYQYDSVEDEYTPCDQSSWIEGETDVSSYYLPNDKKNLLEDAKKWASIRYREKIGNFNTGFEYDPSERNYVLAFDYLLGDVDDVVEAIASYLGISSDDPRYDYIEEQVGSFNLDIMDLAKIEAIRFREWVFTHLVGVLGVAGKYEGVYDLLKDKLAYNPNRVISPGWDDQDFLYLFGEVSTIALCSDIWGIRTTSPIHRKLMDVAYHSRCATGLLDIPRSLDKKYVYNDESGDMKDWGYAQKLARYVPENADFTADVTLFHSHSALFTCWGRYQYSSLARQSIAPPSFLALLIQKAMIMNQSLQYEWILPTDRKQNVKVGKLDYDIPQKLLDKWQSSEGVGVNCLTVIPDLGTTLWGNSTLYEVPPATYQALANLSTRYLVNAVENVVYKTGVGITFQYANNEAFSTMVAGCLPILDTMKNAGAILDYRIKMSLDINELDQVSANSVIGTIYIVVAGVVNDITVDLIALPPTTDLSTIV